MTVSDGVARPRGTGTPSASGTAARLLGPRGRVNRASDRAPDRAPPPVGM